MSKKPMTVHTVIMTIFYLLSVVDLLAVAGWLIEDSTWIVSISNIQLETGDDVIIVLSAFILLLYGVDVFARRYKCKQ